MNGFVDNIEKLTMNNDDFRHVIYTAKNSQLVLMSLQPGEEIGEEVHQLDQFLRIEDGRGEAILDDVSHEISDGFAIVVPQGTKHNIINTGETSMKIYTLYSPPNHLDGTVHHTKAEAEADESEHFDGKTSE